MEIRETKIEFEPVKVDNAGAPYRTERQIADLITFSLFDSQFLEFIRIPQGSFLMGSTETEVGSRSNERPRHSVAIDTFFLGRIPITQGQWKAITGMACRGGAEAIGDWLPAVNVWLDEAIAFCRILSEKTGRSIRLPAEAEWEYACRAGTSTAFCFGDAITHSIANYADDNSNTDRERRLKASSDFEAPNEFGLLDMHGNVWEWCSDLWHEDYRGCPTDGTPWVTDGDAGYCVQRGGSWRNSMLSCRSASRVGDIARNDEDIVGLRVCFTA